MGKILNIGAFRLNTHCKANKSGHFFRIVDIPDCDHVRLLNIHNKRAFLVDADELIKCFTTVNFLLLTRMKDNAIKSIDRLIDYNNKMFYKDNQCQK